MLLSLSVMKMTPNLYVYPSSTLIKLTKISALSTFCSKVFVDAPLFAGMELTESDWSRDFNVTDQDVSQKRSFNIIEGSLNVSSPSLGDLVDPFSAEANGW